MAENINISFAPNKNADEAQRIADIENYLQTLTERTKFALSTIIENYNETDDNKTSQLKQNIALQSVSDSVRVSDSVGKFTDADKTSEIFNDYSGNTAYGNYSHVEGYKNRMDSEGAIRSWATHIEGQENTEASKTSCPSDKKASNNHIEGKMNSSYGRFNHIEGGNCTAEYDTQCCHVEGSNSRVSEGARVAHVEGKDCVAGNECSHAEGKSAQATGYASHAEGESCIASGNYSHAGGLSSEASGKCSYTGGELGTASGDYSHTEGLSNTASGAYSYALGKNNTAIGEYSVASGVESKAKGGYDIAYGYKCIANGESMAIGIQNEASNNSYAFGYGLKAYGLNTVAFGRYNKETYARFVIGGGTANNPFDVLWVDRECNLHVAGKVIANGGIDIPIATADSVGGVKIGDNIAVATDGTISVDLSSYLQSADISDWAKQPEKPVYTADEVGAAEEQHTHSTADITDFPAIPTKVSELQNDSGYISEETDPTVPDWAKAETKPTYTADEVGAAESVHTHAQSDIAGLASALDGKANTSHTHKKSDITDMPTSLKNPNALTVQFNSTTNQTYDGSVAKTVNITPAGIGAATEQQITDAKNDCITDMSVSGKVITYTKGDGSTGTITTQDTNTDTKVTNTLAPTTKAYITGTTTATTNTGTQVFDTGVYLDNKAGNLTATQFNGKLNGNATSASKVNNAVNINGESYDGSSAKTINLLPFIVGTQTASTAVWTGNAPTVSSLFDGLTIRYWLPYNSVANKSVSLKLTLSDGTVTDEIPCYWRGTTRITTHYAAGCMVTLTYRSSVSISGSGSYTGWWADGDYNSNTTNTAGSTNTSSKIFLVGTTSQSTYATTYSHDTVYVGADGCLYSNGTKVSVEGHTHAYLPDSGKGAISEEHSFWSGTSSHTFNYVSGRNRAFIIAWMDDAKSTYMGFNLIYAATTVNTTSAVRLAYNGTVSMSYSIANGNITIGGGAGGYACRCAIIWFTV